MISLLEGIATTRAIRRYTTDPIPDDDLATIMFAASRAPSGSNRQPFRFLVLRDGPKAIEAKRLLGNAFRAGWAAKVASDGYEERHRVATTRRRRRAWLARCSTTSTTSRRSRSSCWRASCGTAMSTTRRARRSTRRARTCCSPHARSGYGGALTGWHAFVETELRELLGIPDGVALSATITLGRPEGHHGPVRRRPIRELVYDDMWGGDAAWAVDPPDARFTSAGPPKRYASSCFSAWPPNCSRIAARILFAKTDASRDSKRS